MLVYTSRLTNRNRYAFRLLLAEVLGLPIEMTDDAEAFRAFDGPRLSYGPQPVFDELHFRSHTLLFETGLSEQNIHVTQWNDCPIFFQVAKQPDFPFDPFAAAFYLVSRYEEYLPHIRDEYDRFDAHHSLAWQNGFLREPVVNQWAERLQQYILQRYPSLVFPERKYRYLSTLDIDNAWAYREKGLMRTIGGFGKSMLNFDFREVLMRIKVITGMRRDPYDTYDFQLDLQKRYHFRPAYFFLVADYGVNDKNVPVQSRRFQSLIKNIADYADVGVHPSFGSNKEPDRLRVEIGRLKTILHRDITRSRQHFLMLKFPGTYRNLIERDITDDYSMGFANEIGYRAGICTPFNFYDLDLEIETKLRVHPFAVMDATLKYYMKVPPERAMEEVQPIIDATRKVKGEFVSLWHNESLSDEKQWKGWRTVYEQIVEEAST